MMHRRCAFVALVLLLLPVCHASAADADRAGRWDYFGIARYTPGDDTTNTFFGGVERIDFEPAAHFGFGAGYNVNDHVNVNATVMFGRAEWTFSEEGFLPATDTGPMIQALGNVDWNVLDAPLTPFLTAGAGVIMFPDSPLVGAGEFNYGAGAGVRWDFAEHAFVKIWYRAEFFGLANADHGIRLHTFNVGIGIMR